MKCFLKVLYMSLGSHRRIVEACNVRRQLRLSSSAISSVLQRER